MIVLGKKISGRASDPRPGYSGRAAAARTQGPWRPGAQAFKRSSGF